MQYQVNNDEEFTHQEMVDKVRMAYGVDEATANKIVARFGYQKGFTDGMANGMIVGFLTAAGTIGIGWSVHKIVKAIFK